MPWLLERDGRVVATFVPTDSVEAVRQQRRDGGRLRLYPAGSFPNGHGRTIDLETAAYPVTLEDDTRNYEA